MNGSPFFPALLRAGGVIITLTAKCVYQPGFQTPKIPMSDRRRERGVTILIVAVAMIAMLAMLALAIDVVSLYAAEGDAQRTADAASWR
jgi:hypothetical protein